MTSEANHPERGSEATKSKDAEMWCVYIIECKDGSLYTGVTTDPVRRFKEHQRAGSHYTSYNPANKLAYKESFTDQSLALKRETQIKGWTRRKKLALITGNLPSLKRL